MEGRRLERPSFLVFFGGCLLACCVFFVLFDGCLVVFCAF